MVVNRVFIAAAFAFAPLITSAQEATLKAYVPNTDIVQDRAFWLVIEASGATVEFDTLPECDGVVINTAAPQQSTHIAMGGGVQQQQVRVSFPAYPIRAGKVSIPPIRATINGKAMKTEEIVLDAKPAPPGSAAEANARAWVDDDVVIVGRPFWIYVEARGIQIEMPDMIEADGIEIDPVNVQRSMSSSSNQDGQLVTAKRGYHAVATRAGAITIPPIEVKVTGRIVKTEPLEVTAMTLAAQPQTPAPGAEPSEQQLTADDLVFIRMDTDKKTAYQGESILLTMQLWRIQNRRVTAGPYRGSLITGPTTEGFFTRDLEVSNYDAKNGPWLYDVSETRRLLYPTRPGTLRVGTWHWEGIALINRQSVTQRDRLSYKFDAGPIDIDVKPLPPAPAGFTGGVGAFQVAAEIGGDVVTQGVPVALKVRVDGFGNPDAVGDPQLPKLAWARAGEPDRRVEFKVAPENAQPRAIKDFVFALTPLQAGRGEIPAFPFVHFDPASGAYKTTMLGPFTLDVVASGEEGSRLIASPDVPVASQRVEILAEDIAALMERPALLAPDRGTQRPVWVLAFLAPMVAYVGVRMALGKKRRDAANAGWTRSQRARSSGLRRLRGVMESQDPADALYRAVVAYVSDALNLDQAGMTSGDVRAALERSRVPAGIVDRTVQILRACERARYGTQRLSADELGALMSGAEACMNALEAHTNGGKRM